MQLFCDPDFMAFSAGVHDPASAHARFDEMLRTAIDVPFAKQPLVERVTGSLVGYSGVAWFDFEGTRRLEFGYRLVPEARGRGYATEAGRALAGELARLLGPISLGRAWLFALASGLAEEAFFRGALQPRVGFLAATLLFAAAHFVPAAKLWGWALFALVAGALFGALFAATGDLLAPFLAHALVNGLNLRWLASRERPVPEPAGLVV